MRKLYRDISTLDIAARQKITGIGPRRAEIIVPGTAVLLHVLEAFRMPALFYSAAGVRDGIIADLAARGIDRGLTQLSVEQRSTVEKMAEHYGVPLRHARKVARLANDLFLGFQNAHRLPAHYGRLLEAAAYLHDTGHYVSDTRHHKHSYYLVANSDLPGFTLTERELIANLCRYHRKAMPTPEHGNLQLLDVRRPARRGLSDSAASHGGQPRSQPRAANPVCRVPAARERFPDHSERFAGNRYRSGNLGGGAAVGSLPAGLQQAGYCRPVVMITAANFADLEGLVHGFGERSSTYPEGITTAKQIHSAIVAERRRGARSARRTR